MPVFVSLHDGPQSITDRAILIVFRMQNILNAKVLEWCTDISMHLTTCLQVPLFFDELDTLDLTGLGVGDEGATALRDVLCQNPPLSRLVLTDNGLSKEGAVALADALESNSNLKVGCHNRVI